MEREVAGHRLGDLHHEIDGYRIYAAHRKTDNQPFLAKAPATEFPPLAEVQRLERELDKITERERELHDAMARSATDHERLRELQAELAACVCAREDAEAAWLETAAALEA
jgi:hypothetical protein